MWLKDIFKRKPTESSLPLFDEAFLRRLERLSLRTAPSLRGAMWGERRSRNLRPAFDFSDHRPYASGDDLRHVDWNVYGRHEALFVKLGEATQSVQVHVLLDRSRSMAWTPDPASPLTSTVSSRKWDSARRLTGALGYLGLAGGERVTLTPLARALDESFGPTRGKQQVIHALQFLSAVTPAPPLQAAGGLASSLTDYARAHPRGGVLALVSDLLDSVPPPASPPRGAGIESELAEALRHFPPPRWQVFVLHLLTRQEIRPTLQGDADLQDVETGQRLPFRLDERTLSRYRSRVQRWCAEQQAICARRGATYTRILAEWPIERAVIPYLRRRRVVQ